MNNKETDIEKKVDTLFKLEECSWKEYDRRHTSEWQINFSLWAGLAILTGYSIKEEYSLPLWAIPWAIGIFVLIALIYIYFQWGMFNSNRKDKDRRFYYLKKIHPLMDIELPKDYDKLPWTSSKKFIFNWSHASQILITLLLLAIACLVLTGCF